MLPDLVIQFFNTQPRRERSVFGLLTGKQTISILYAALSHHQLQWLHLYPGLSKEAFLAAVTRLKAQKYLAATETGLVLTEAGQKRQIQAAQMVSLPGHYQPWMRVDKFAPRFFLAVQVLSEASYHSQAYRPISTDWATQQAVKRWYRKTPIKTAVTELTDLFERLPESLADELAANLVGHEYAGQHRPATLQAHFANVNALAAVVREIAAAKNQWYALWGGPQDLVTRPAQATLKQVWSDVDLATVAAQSHRKMSTVKEHLLLAAIMGQDVPITKLIPPAVHHALDQATQWQDHQALLATIPDSEFFQIRLFQIFKMQGRWPRAAT